MPFLRMTAHCRSPLRGCWTPEFPNPSPTQSHAKPHGQFACCTLLYSRASPSNNIGADGLAYSWNVHALQAYTILENELCSPGSLQQRSVQLRAQGDQHVCLFHVLQDLGFWAPVNLCNLNNLGIGQQTCLSRLQPLSCLVPVCLAGRRKLPVYTESPCRTHDRRTRLAPQAVQLGRLPSSMQTRQWLSCTADLPDGTLLTGFMNAAVDGLPDPSEQGG